MGLRESQLQGQEHSFNVEAISLVEGIDQNQDLSFWAQGSGIAGPRRESVEGSEALSLDSRALVTGSGQGEGESEGEGRASMETKETCPHGGSMPISVI